jgi:hypothetical protein
MRTRFGDQGEYVFLRLATSEFDSAEFTANYFLDWNGSFDARKNDRIVKSKAAEIGK